MGTKVKQQGQPSDAPYNVFDMRDHPKNRDHEGDCKWRCGNNSRCIRYEFDAITLTCNMFEESKDDPARAPRSTCSTCATTRKTE